MKKKFKFSISNFQFQRGQSLITLLFFMVIGITVVTAAALILSADMLSSTNNEKGLSAYYNAESGIEDGILYILRYHPTDSIHPVSLTLTGTAVTITYDSATQTNTILSVGSEGTTKRTVSAQTAFTGGAFSTSGWREQ